jgi:hypothetical protein
MRVSQRIFGLIAKTAVVTTAAFLLLSALASAEAATSSARVQTWLQKANAQSLAESAYWHTLLHYQHRLRGWKSRVDDPDFFLSPVGRHDPEAELNATLRALFRPVVEGEKHAAVRFPARLEWLKAELGIPDAELPLPCSPEFEKIFQSIKAESVTLVFPTAFMNTPASLFGHTLLHIGSGRKSPLLNQAVNYSAFTPEKNILSFAFKGIFGFYEGYYNVVPYYQKVQEYNDIEQRDVWEYKLDLSPVEIRRLMLHVFEMRDIHSDYFFFTENCSYNLLYLLDAARPGHEMAAHTPPWVIPIDTIRLMQKCEFIDTATYRPSRATKLRHMNANMSDNTVALALAVARGQRPAESVATDGLSEGEQRQTLDLAAECLQSWYGKKKLSRDEYVPIFFNTLKIRSKLKTAQPGVSDFPAIPVPCAPDRGHRSGRLTLGGGYDGREWFQALSIRGAYHDLLDSADGYVEGAQIDFLNLDLRYYPETEEEKHLDFSRLTLVGIRSLVPFDAFYQPLSWEFDASLMRERTEDDQRHTFGRMALSAGLCRQFAHGNLAYGMLTGQVRAGGALAHTASLGVGGKSGLLFKIGGRYRALAEIYGRAFPTGGQSPEFGVTLQQNWKLSQNTALVLELKRGRGWDRTETSGQLSCKVYF